MVAFYPYKSTKSQKFYLSLKLENKFRVVHIPRMCGAISIQYDPKLIEQLAQFFSPQEIEAFAAKGEIVFAYRDKRPVLPVRSASGIKLIDWGNRDRSLPLPKTGWARLESLLEKRWDRYKPKVVRIPAIRGCEKKTWFSLDTDIKAVLVQRDGVERVYMITEAASEEFLKVTGHGRMPRRM